MKEKVLDRLDLKPNGYAVLTAHRPENVDSPERLKKIVDAMIKLKELIIVFPVHPRTRRKLKEANLQKKMKGEGNLKLIKPVKYHEMLNLIKKARIVFTDSGGMQKEAFWLQTPCVTLREETEWTETIDLEANVLVGTDPQRIVMETKRTLRDESIKRRLKAKTNPFGDGKASEKILNTLKDFGSFR